MPQAYIQTYILYIHACITRERERERERERDCLKDGGWDPNKWTKYSPHEQELQKKVTTNFHFKKSSQVWRRKEEKISWENVHREKLYFSFFLVLIKTERERRIQCWTLWWTLWSPDAVSQRPSTASMVSRRAAGKQVRPQVEALEWFIHGNVDKLSFACSGYCKHVQCCKLLVYWVYRLVLILLL